MPAYAEIADPAPALAALTDALSSALGTPVETPAPAAVDIASLASPTASYPEIVSPPAQTAPRPVELASALPPARSLPEVASLAPPPAATPLPSSPQFATQAPSVADTDKQDWWAQLPAGSSIRVSNGAGRNLMAARFAYYLSDHGLSVARIANAPSFKYRQTIIFYNPDQKEFAHKLGSYFPFPVKYGEAPKGHGQVEVILGSDVLDFDAGLKL